MSRSSNTALILNYLFDMAVHLIRESDLNDYIKLLAEERSCTVEEVNRQKSHWEFIFSKSKCLEKVELYRQQLQRFSCSICFKTFGFKRNMKRHKKTIHTEKVLDPEIKWYFCQICNKHFKARSSRDRHRRNLHSKPCS